MYPPHLTYLNKKGRVWFNPGAGILEFWDEFRKLKENLNLPFKEVWGHRDLKRIKEIYVSSIVALNLSSSSNQQQKWWITKPKQDPPDGVIGTIVYNGKIPEMHVREIEIIEHMEGDNILETLQKKLRGKRYELNTILVCLISTPGIFDLQEIASQIQSEATSLDHIFFVFHGTQVPKSKNKQSRTTPQISLVQVKPVFATSTIVPSIDCEACRTGKESMFFIFEGRGKGDHRAITLDNPPRIYDQ